MKRNFLIFSVLALFCADKIFSASLSESNSVTISYRLSAQTTGLEVTNDDNYLYSTHYLAAFRLQYKKMAGMYIGVGMNEIDIKGTGPFALDADNRGSFLFGIDGVYPLGPVSAEGDVRILIGKTSDHSQPTRKYFFTDTRLRAGVLWPLGIFRLGSGGVLQKMYLNPSEAYKGTISDLDGRLYISGGVADPVGRGSLDLRLEANPAYTRMADGRPQRWALSVVVTGYHQPRRLRGRDGLDRRYYNRDGWKRLEEKAKKLEKEIDAGEETGSSVD